MQWRTVAPRFFKLKHRNTRKKNTKMIIVCKIRQTKLRSVHWMPLHTSCFQWFWIKTLQYTKLIFTARTILIFTKNITLLIMFIWWWYFLIFIVFKNAPPTPPSAAQKQILNEEPINFIESLKRLVTNLPYVLLLVAYGINVGVFYAISTLLNQIVLQYYPVCTESSYSNQSW